VISPRVFVAMTSRLPKVEIELTFVSMKTVTKQEALLKKRLGKSAGAFRARLNRISPKPISGVSEVLFESRRSESQHLQLYSRTK